MNDRTEPSQEIIRFGNWSVTDYGVEWAKPGDPPYEIHKSRLWEIRPSEVADGICWDWLVHLTEKSWLSEADIYHLNSALFFAQDYHKDSRPDSAVDASTSATLKLQREQLDRRRPSDGYAQ